MINKTQDLIKKLRKISGETEFFKELKKHFEENYDKIYFETIKLVPFPPFYLPLSESSENESLLKELSNCNKTNKFRRC